MSPPSQRWLLPPLAVTALALLGSLGLHVPAYVGLGVLDLLTKRASRSPAPIEIELLDARPSEAHESVASDPAPVVEDDGAHPPRETPPEREEPRTIAEVPLPAPVREEPVPEPQPPAPQARPEEARATSVTQRSRDPSVPPPENAQYLAEQNNRVEEETVARITNTQVDDPEPQLSRPQEPSQTTEEGDSAERQAAAMRETEGLDERDPTPEEAPLQIERAPRQRRPSRSRTPAASEAALGGAREGAPPAPERAASAAGGGRQARGGGERAMTEILVQDGTGTFRVRVPNDRPLGEGHGEGGGVAVAGSGGGNEGDGSASGRAGRSRRRARGGGSGGAGAPDLRLSWTQFSSIYGEEELERERELWLQQRRSQTRGTTHQQRWERFRAAIENYVANVRPGNQTALNARADPFAAYLANIHRRIHMRFADSFLRALPSTVEPVFRANPSMHTKLEIAIDPAGRVARIGVVATSGDILFDFGAYNSVIAAQPFEATPEAIRSPDGLVYMHWSFYRNERQCGTFNAEAYILAGAPTPAPPRAAPMEGGTLFDPARVEREQPDPGSPHRAREIETPDGEAIEPAADPEPEHDHAH